MPVSLSELEKRVKADSNDPAAHYNVALAYWNARKWIDVDRELHLAAKLEPRFAEAHLALAFLPYARQPTLWRDLSEATREVAADMRKMITESDREYRQAFLIDPMVDMRIIAAATPSTVSFWDVQEVLGSIVALYYQGKIDCSEGRYTDCEAKFTRLLADLKDARALGRLPSDIYWYQGLAAAHEKHYDLALKDFQLLIDREQADVKKIQAKGLLRVPLKTNEYRYFMAAFNNAAGNTNEAERLYREALENDLGLYAAHVRLAEIYEVRKDWAKAVDERRNAVNANPDDLTLQMDLGLTLGRAGKLAEAEEALKTSTEGLPRNTLGWYWLGIVEQQLGQKAAAKAAFERVVALAPSRMQAVVDRAKQRLVDLQ
jgi:tetratricopeptide (TPR) repeat protein